MSDIRDTIKFAQSLKTELSQFYSAEKDDYSLNELSPIYDEISTADQRYDQKETIGQGGMKVISKVYDHKSGRYVAFATLREEAPKELYEPFLREARLTASLEHPNIIPVYDVGIRNTKPFFTMELKTGHTLTQRIWQYNAEQKQRMEGIVSTARTDLRETVLHDILNIFIKVCDAVSYAHSRSILHLDLKPDNIQIGHYGEVLVCDWGLAKLIGESSGDFDQLSLNKDLLNNMTIVGEIKGTPGYMAPEQIERNATKNFATDVYAMGAILYAILTGKQPIDGDTEDILDKTAKGVLITPSNRTPERQIPKSLNAVVAKAMSLEPANRYSSINELKTEVQNYLTGYATNAENAGFITLLGLLFKRNRTLCSVIAIFSICLVIFSFVFIAEVQNNEARALTLHKTAERERDIARNTLELYKKEQERTRILGSKIDNKKISEVVEFTSEDLYSDRTQLMDFHSALKDLSAVIKSNPYNSRAISEKGYLLFIMQRFSEAQQYLKRAKGHGVIHELCFEHALRFPGPGPLPPDKLATLCRRIMNELGETRRPLTEKMMVYDSLIRTQLKFHWPIVKAVLHNFNPLWNAETFDYDEKKRTLTIGGKGLRTFLSDRFHTSQSNVLRTLRIKRLVLTNTDFDNLDNISKLYLSVLDIRGTKVSTLPHKKTLRLITEIICRKGQFSDKQKKKLPDHVTLTEL